MNHLNTTAIYTIRQHGQDTHFYSYCAGGFSYPFHVADWLNRVDFDLNGSRVEDEKLPVAALLPQMRGDYKFPEAAKGLCVFRAVTESEAVNHLSRTAVNERIPFCITLDLDREMVCFSFSRDCPELNLPDLELPIQGMHNEFGGAMLHDAATCEEAGGTGAPSVAELSETVYERLIRDYAAEQFPQESPDMRMN